MANLDFDSEGMKQVRLEARRGAHVQRAQQMLVAAGLAALCVVGIVGVLLAQVMKEKSSVAVIAGLVPAIHLTSAGAHRDKPGGDDGGGTVAVGYPML